MHEGSSQACHMNGSSGNKSGLTSGELRGDTHGGVGDTLVTTHRTKVRRLQRQLLLPLWKLGCDCGLLLKRRYSKVPSTFFLGPALYRASWGAVVRISSLTKEGGCLLLLWL